MSKPQEGVARGQRPCTRAAGVYVYGVEYIKRKPLMSLIFDLEETYIIVSCHGSGGGGRIYTI
jgi:hypothetical protein